MLKKSLKYSKILLAILTVVTVTFAALPVSALSADAIPYGTPAVDGKMDDIWNGSSNKIAIDFVNEGENTGVKGYARLMWDEKFLYVLGYVSDATPSSKVADNVYWGTDSFEVFLDEENTHSSNKKDISQFRVSRSGEFTGMLDEEACNATAMLAEYKGAQWGSDKNSNNEYTVELAIPWTRVSNAKKGNMVGIEFQINDDTNNDATSDCIINSEVNYEQLWTPIAYRMMTLTDIKADASAPTTSNDEPTASTDDKKPTASQNNSSVDNTSDVLSSEEDGTDSDTTTTGTESSTDSSNAQTVVIEEEADNSSLIIIAAIVGGVVLIAGILCVVLLLRKPKK